MGRPQRTWAQVAAGQKSTATSGEQRIGKLHVVEPVEVQAAEEAKAAELGADESKIEACPEQVPELQPVDSANSKKPETVPKKMEPEEKSPKEIEEEKAPRKRQEEEAPRKRQEEQAPRKRQEEDAPRKFEEEKAPRKTQEEEAPRLEEIKSGKIEEKSEGKIEEDVSPRKLALIDHLPEPTSPPRRSFAPPPGLSPQCPSSSIGGCKTPPWRAKKIQSEKGRTSFSSETTVAASRKTSAASEEHVIRDTASDHSTEAATNSDDNQEAFLNPEICWPANHVQPMELQMVGEAAQKLFGTGFHHMMVRLQASIISQGHAQGSPMPQLQVKLQLSEDVKKNLLAPLARMHGALSTFLPAHGCQVMVSHRSKDNAALFLSCSIMDDNSCWDLLKTGYCQRAYTVGCRWHHPVPVMMCIRLAGDNLDQRFTPQMVTEQFLGPTHLVSALEAASAAAANQTGEVVQPNLATYED